MKSKLLLVLAVAVGVALLPRDGAASADPSLVAYWSFDEGSGTVASDSSGNGNDGSLYGPTWVAGHSGSALEFDGTDDYLEVPDDDTLDLTTGATVMAWVKVSGTTGKAQVLVSKWIACPGEWQRTWVLELLPDGVTPQWATSIAGVYHALLSSVTIPIGSWFHYAGTYDGSVKKIYVNGQETAAYSVSGTLDTNSNPLQLGRHAFETCNEWQRHWFKGVLDEVKIYNRALSEPEIWAEALRGRTYTLDADFDEGVLVSVNHDAPNNDQLQLDEPLTTFPFIWIALSGRGTIVKVDTETGTVLGEYLSAPEGRGRDPSRTTVDLNGDLWAGNRGEASGGKGSAVHIGLNETNHCVDRNDNGLIDTSTGLGDVRPWPNPGGVDDNGGVSSAEDECIINYVRVNGRNTRTVAVDANNGAWIGGFNFSDEFDHDLVRATPDGSGAILRSISPGCGGYGGLIDGSGVLWSAGSVFNQLLRYDPSTDTATCIPLGTHSYGLGIDGAGNIWHSTWMDNSVHKISPAGSILDTFPLPSGCHRGVAVTLADQNVWVANSCGNQVNRLTNQGALVATIPVGIEPTGVAVDAAGKVWVTNLGSNNAMRIDPASNTVDLTMDLGTGAGPYNYSDMTGVVSRAITAPQGIWTVIFDSGQAGTGWGTVSWNIENAPPCPATPEEREPAGTTISARARSAETITDLGAATYLDAPNGIAIDPPDGRYLQVELKLTTTISGVSPTVCDVTITPALCPDTDDDGCSDCEELESNPALGGTRDPLNRYDFYDVPVPTAFDGGTLADRDQAVSIINDVLAVLEYTGCSDGGPANGLGRQYNQDNNGDELDDGLLYDRSVGATWSDAPDGAINIIVDVLLVLAQSGHSCQAPP